MNLIKHFKTFQDTGHTKLFLIMIGVALIGITLPSFAQSYYDDQPTSSTPSYAQQNQIELTDKGSIKVGFYTDPAAPNTSSQTKLYIIFLNKDSGITQQHVDYKVFIKMGTDKIFGIPVTHTAEGSATVPFKFTNPGTYQVVVEVDGILFQPIPPETAVFTVNAGSSTVPEFPFAVPVLLIGITSLIAFYNIKFRK